jgi:hypothetical protein
MKNIVYGPGHIDIVRHIMAHRPKTRMLDQMRGVPFASGDQIIDRKNIPSVVDKVVAQMRT